MNRDGFISVSMITVLTFGIFLVAVSWNELRAVQGAESRAATERIAVIAQGVRDAYRTGTGFPAALNQVGPYVLLDVQRRWDVDPFGRGMQFAYSSVGTAPVVVSVRSRGEDGVFGTMDDYSVTIDEQIVGRQMTATRLRLVRAKIFESDYMTPKKAKQRDIADLRAEVFTYVDAQRELLFADPLDLPAIIARRDAAAVEIDRLRAKFKAKKWPKTVAGKKGLIDELNLDIEYLSDGFGTNLIANSHVGIMSAGGDRQGGTLDDL